MSVQQHTHDRSPAWRIGQVTAGHLLQNKRGPAGLVSIGPDQTVVEALVLLEGQELPELPVLEASCVVGNLSDLSLAREVHHGGYLGDKTVRQIMEPPLAQVDVDADIHEVYRLLRGGQPGLIVTRGSTPVGFLNRVDLVDHWRRQTAWNGSGI